MGVDFVPAFSRLSFAPEPPAPLLPLKINTPPSQTRDPVSPGVSFAAPMTSDRAARQAAMDALHARYEADCPHKSFVTAHTRLVWGEGDLEARIVFVGEAPGEEEDRQGRPFVGRSGQLLDKMIAAIGLKREDVYICNVLKTRPPDNATPTPREIELCEPYLREQIAIIAPRAMVTLGLSATRALLKTDESMTKMRGKWRSYALPDERQIPLMPTFHPAYVLRNYTEETRRQVWSDLKMVVDRLSQPA